MGLYQKHRPTEFEQVVGNEGIVQSISRMLKKKETFPHAVLFHGPSGCGKTTLARIIGNELGATKRDLREIDSAQFRGIDTVRELRNISQYRPIGGTVTVFIIDEVHKMTNDAQNGLLKILEDPPEHVYFILCTTEPNKLLKTVRGRCSDFQVQTLSDLEMKKLLKGIAKKEKKVLDKTTYKIIVQNSFGHPRNAINILEQVINVPKEERTKLAKRVAVEEVQAIELCRALFKRAHWGEINKILKGLKDQEPETIRRIVLGYCSSTLLNTDKEIAGIIMEEFIEPFYNTGFPGLVYACYAVTKR